MSTDYLDRPLHMPDYPSHGTPAGSTVELDDTPGSRIPAATPATPIPCEPFDDSPIGRTVLRRQLRLHIASRLLAGAITDVTTLTGTNGHAKLAADSVRLADTLIRVNDEFDRTPPAQPAAVAVTGGPHTADCVKTAERLPLTRNDHSYLLWLSNFDAVPPSAVCPPLGPDMSARCRRRLMSLGYVAGCMWEDSHGFGLTAAGRAVVARESFDVLKLGEQEDAA